MGYGAIVNNPTLRSRDQFKHCAPNTRARSSNPPPRRQTHSEKKKKQSRLNVDSVDKCTQSKFTGFRSVKRIIRSCAPPSPSLFNTNNPQSINPSPTLNHADDPTKNRNVIICWRMIDLNGFIIKLSIGHVQVRTRRQFAKRKPTSWTTPRDESTTPKRVIAELISPFRWRKPH